MAAALSRGAAKSGSRHAVVKGVSSGWSGRRTKFALVPACQKDSRKNGLRTARVIISRLVVTWRRAHAKKGRIAAPSEPDKHYSISRGMNAREMPEEEEGKDKNKSKREARGPGNQ